MPLPARHAPGGLRAGDMADGRIGQGKEPGRDWKGLDDGPARDYLAATDTQYQQNPTRLEFNVRPPRPDEDPAMRSISAPPRKRSAPLGKVARGLTPFSTALKASTSMTTPESEKLKPLSPDTRPAATKSAGAVRTWTSEQLFGDANEARILHRGETYRLLRTRSQKLILIK